MAANKVTAVHRRWKLLPSGPLRADHWEPTRRDRAALFLFSRAWSLRPETFDFLGYTSGTTVA